MCGIVGGIGPGMDRTDEAACRAALACIRHRGPDAEGLWRAPGIMLGHRRLSILDLDPRAHQPMRRGPLTIVFNGEVYNFRELRRSLEAAGHSFTTTCDTEVLLAGLVERGAAFLDQVEGMFAFGAFDERDHSLLLARDRFGEKPLFLLRQSDRLLFASELGALEALSQEPLHEDKIATGLYFRFSYVPAPFAPLKDTSQLEPGTFARVGENLASTTETYYRLPPSTQAPRDYSGAVDELRGRFESLIQALTALDGRTHGHGERLNLVQNDIETVRVQIMEQLQKMADLQERLRRKRLEELDREIKELKRYAIKLAEESGAGYGDGR